MHEAAVVGQDKGQRWAEGGRLADRAENLECACAKLLTTAVGDSIVQDAVEREACQMPERIKTPNPIRSLGPIFILRRRSNRYLKGWI